MNVIPKKGRPSEADLERETARRLHAGKESGISDFGQRGLDRVRFARAVALTVSVHRIGLVLQSRERERLKGERLRKAASGVTRLGI